MKIVILVNNLTAGGAERVAAMWAEGFHKRGHEVSVVIFDDKSPITYKIPPEVGIICVATKTRNKLIRSLLRIYKLYKVLKKEKCDVLIDVMPTFWKRVAMIGMKCKKVSTEHWSFERPRNATIRPKKINKIYLNRLYNHVTVLTQADKNVIGNQLKNVTVLPNPLALPPAKDMPPKKKVILATGRLDAWYVKGFDVLIKAWAKIADKTEGWKVQIVGDSKKGGLEGLQRLCAEYGVNSSVEFVGFQSDILPFYQDASIFVLSSRYEGFGLVLIEAMSQGCACIACDYKGRQKEIIQSKDVGVICKPDNVDNISSAILFLIHDEQKRRVMGENAVRRSMDFSLDKIMERWDEILKDLV